MDTLSENNLIELRHNPTMREGISRSLVKVVSLALPDESEVRKKLNEWLNISEDCIVFPDELKTMEAALSDFAYTSGTESGEVGRLPSEASGKIVSLSPDDPFDAVNVSSAVALSLAIRRFLVLYRLGATIVVLKQK